MAIKYDSININSNDDKEEDEEDKWENYAGASYLDDPEPILRIPGFDIAIADDVRLVLPKQILSEETQRRICEEVKGRCVVCFREASYEEGGRAMPLLHRLDILRELEDQPTLDEEAFAFLGLYRLRPARPSTRELIFPRVPSFIVRQASDGDPHIYDTQSTTTSTPVDEGTPRNQYWKIHKPPAIILGFLFSRVKSVFYNEKEGEYVPPEECGESARLYVAVLFNSLNRPRPVSPSMELEGTSGIGDSSG
ncbi:hypothetical protein VNI00_005169 [Paramarasmius palmivorus]|uniref:Uncharacterized protein n=1 Tax=Paramarasmius palmivorus TaxID=297713 RepID=A0AAW0DLE2_9AGAR